MLWKFIHFYDKNKGILSKCHPLYSALLRKVTYRFNKIIIIKRIRFIQVAIELKTSYIKKPYINMMLLTLP